MGRLAVYKYFSFLYLLATFAVAGFTFYGLFGGNVNPAGNAARAMLVYVMPALIAVNVLLLPYWLIRRRWHWAAIPVVTLLCCLPYCRTIYQFGNPEESKEAAQLSGIKVATYNVAMFGHETTGFIAQDILAEMKRQKVEVLCMQEYADQSGDRDNADSYKEYFPYMAKGRSDMVVYSRFPIRGSKNIEFDQTNNSGMWADIDAHGKQFRIFNVHLETTSLNRTLGKAAKLEAQGFKVEGNRVLSAVYGNYTRGMVVRAAQAEEVAQEIAKSTLPVVVCGDFNDVPYSYTYNTMLGPLVDGFKECGHGFMYTYRGGKKMFRIDYIFHSEQITGVDYYKYELTYSDHFPVFMKFQL